MKKSGIFPPEFPRELATDPFRKAELEVFQRLRDQLQEFTVFYNCSWLDNKSNYRRTDGEADFIVAHSKWGFVVLEVKGGRISRDEHTRQWWSKNRYGESFKIKNPVDQARTSKHVILNKVRSNWKGTCPFIRTAHGVIFPDSGEPRRTDALGADMPIDIFLFKENLENLGAGVISILLAEPEGTTTKYEELGEQGVEILHRLFDYGFDLKVPLSTELDESDAKIFELSEQQKAYLDFTSLQSRAVINGGAGTGKTTLAIEKCRRLAETGASILLLCFNNPLGEYLNSQFKDFKNVTASSFHKFCESVATRTELLSDPLTSRTTQYYFDALLPDALLNALSENDDLRFDAIIVDEGQDFYDNWWPPLILAMKEDSGVFYVFKDDNQRIYGPSAMDIAGMPKEPLHLSVNFRNTKPIFSAATRYYQGGEMKSGGPDGKDIEWVKLNPARTFRGVEKQINKLTNIEGVEEQDIAVLCACTLEKSSIYSGDSIGRYTTRRANDLEGDLVIFDSVYRFKGLESKIVILTDLDAAMDSDELMYVGLSRARSLLIVAATESTITVLKKRLSSAT